MSNRDHIGDARTVQLNGERVMTLRKKHGWTREELAAASSVSKRTIDDVEGDKKPVLIATARLIAQAFGLSDLKELTLAGDAVAPKPGDIRPAVTQTKPATVDTKPVRERPASAPPCPLLLIGREAALKELKVRLGVISDRGKATTARPLTVVRGWPGVGKTTIAAAIAHDAEVEVAFPDGVLWASIGQQPQVLTELAEWGRALGTDAIRDAKTVQHARDQLAGLLRDKRMLLIVDDVWAVEHAVPFQAGGRNCAMLVTTRENSVAEALAPTPGDSYELEVLDEASGVELLETLAPEVVKSHRKECRELVRELEGLPLALQVAGRQLHVESQRGWDVTAMLRELREDAGRLLESDAPADMADLIKQSSPKVAVLLRKSTDRLSPEMQERFAFLGGMAPKPAAFRLEDMAGIWETTEEDARRTANELIDRGLLEPVGKGMFWMHALLVKLARSLCAED